MTVESAEDLAAFFDEEEFARPATFTPAGGGAGEPASVVFSQARDEGGLGSVGITTSRFSCLVRVAELTAEPYGWSVEIDGKAYKVQKVERDESGSIYFLPLEEL